MSPSNEGCLDWLCTAVLQEHSLLRRSPICLHSLSVSYRMKTEITVIIPLQSSPYVFFELVLQAVWGLRQAAHMYFCFSLQLTGLNIIVAEESTKCAWYIEPTVGSTQLLLPCSRHVCWNLCNLCSNICSSGSKTKRWAARPAGLLQENYWEAKGFLEYVREEVLVSAQKACRTYRGC